jgi:hypothetical protein
MANFKRTIFGLALGAALLVLAGETAAAQAADQAADKAYAPPRTPDGKPDLQGIWTNASLTTLERQPGQPLVIPAEQAERVETMRARLLAADSARTNPEQGAPKAGNVGGYNAFWTDAGSNYAQVRGETRASWIIDPPDGRIPYTAAGRAAFEAGHKAADGDFDGPEGRTPADRCLVGFGSTGAPPMQNVMYNNHYQLVQTKDHVVIMVEMNHDARIVPIGGKHGPASGKNWLGDSIGWWEGDTLVIETINMNPENVLRLTGQKSFYVGEHPRITERFTRIGPEEILYEFTVDDPVAFETPWRGEMPLLAVPGPIYEYACHEGNYALPDILAGARRFEKEERSNKMTYYAIDPS